MSQSVSLETTLPKVSLETRLAGIALSTCIWNASGPLCTTEAELMALAKTPTTALVVTKSCTVESRLGNQGVRYAEDKGNTINSTGLANLGYKFYDQMASKISPQKPYIVSVSGLTSADNLEIISTLGLNSQISAIELNLSCPNVIGKPQIGYDFEASRELLRKIYEVNDSHSISTNSSPRISIGLKLPPYFDQVMVKNMAEIIDDFPIDFITCINSLGNGLFIDYKTERTLIEPKRGLGGIGGPMIKPFALANVWMFHQELPGLDIVGCGGVTSGADVFEHILAGAVGVAVGSTLMREGPGCFDRISKELKLIMLEKGYRQLSDFRGRLKY